MATRFPRFTGPKPLAVTFDFGQTLADLDTGLLAQRLRARGIDVAPERLESAVPLAFDAYNRGVIVEGGNRGAHPWGALMTELLLRAGVEEARIGASVEWLWSEQPGRNLWRRPVPGMIELLRKLPMPLGVISNSEGRLEELAVELGWRDLFAAFADSGKLGIAKPGPRIFEWTCAQLGVPAARVVHVGDSFAADVRGAVAAGFQGAIWFRGEGDGQGFRSARDAAEVEALLLG